MTLRWLFAPGSRVVRTVECLEAALVTRGLLSVAGEFALLMFGSDVSVDAGVCWWALVAVGDGADETHKVVACFATPHLQVPC